MVYAGADTNSATFVAPLGNTEALTATVLEPLLTAEYDDWPIITRVLIYMYLCIHVGLK